MNSGQIQSFSLWSLWPMAISHIFYSAQKEASKTVIIHEKIDIYFNLSKMNICRYNQKFPSGRVPSSRNFLVDNSMLF